MAGASRGQRVQAEHVYRWGPVWSRRVGWVLDHVWWNTTVHGAEKIPATGPVIIASNHTGVADGPLLHGALPRGSHVLVKQEFFDAKIGFLMTWAGQIPVDRRSGRAALSVAKTMLEEGRVVGIFPEGTRGRGDISSVRAGVAWLAVQSGAPVVPAACLGTRRTGDRRGYVPPPRSRLHVVFGAPIHLDLPDGTTGRQAMSTAMTAISTGLTAHVRDAVALTGVDLPAESGLGAPPAGAADGSGRDGTAGGGE